MMPASNWQEDENVRTLKSWCGPRRIWVLLAVIGVVIPAGIGHAQLPNPLNDLLALGQGLGQTPAMVAVQHNPEPTLAATPRANCGPGSHPLAGVQGRVPGSAINSPAAASGYTCNLSEIAHQGQSGGFKVLRYIDKQGHECGFYDTALLFPINAVRLGGSSLGVAVLDMSDPAHPVQTGTLTDLPMLSPHESLSLNTRRGLLAAVLGNPATYPGLVSIYDVSNDCRHPVLDSTTLSARFGHEGNFSADGNTFYAAGTAVQSVTAIDVRNPKEPHAIWQGNEYSHGLTLSDDGNRAYIADPINSQLLILDTSQIQARAPNPQAREISRLTWGTATIPQNAIPITIHGKKYLLEFDEYAFRYGGNAPPDTVGAARIIDISDETHPRVVSNLRLQVDQPADHHAAAGDPGATSPVQGYAAHYCNVPREIDPGIVACSFIASGLRVFDIRDPLHPKEVAYFIAPPHPEPENGLDGSNFAMSKPAFAPERRELWYSDGTSGFYVLRLDPSVWPNPTGLGGSGSGPGGARRCPSAVGGLSGRRLGTLRLGETRAAARRALRVFATRGRRRMDFFCVRGGGVRAGYASSRVVLLLSDERRYALRGVHPGARVASVARRLRLRSRQGFHVGSNTWFLLPGRTAAGVLKVRHGVVQEVGLADGSRTRDRKATRRFLRSFG
jgi:hypothetical protein